MMSDFLARLAQRSMGAAPLIAPRLPSLFAPVDESPTGNVASSVPIAFTPIIPDGYADPSRAMITGSSFGAVLVERTISIAASGRVMPIPTGPAK